MLKAAAISKSGRRGGTSSVELDVKLEARGEVKISELMLADADAGSSGPLHPLVVRAAGERIVAYLEVYADERWSPDGAEGLLS